MARRIVLFGAALLLQACTISQNVMPVPAGVVARSEVCIIENPDVRPGFLTEYRRVLTERGYTVKMLPAGASVNDCATVSTYIGRWSWDLTIYMSYARILVFHDSNQSGEAVYDATKGGGRLDKFVDAEPKIRELVEQLFPVKGSGN